jgi:hypothetical protein
VTLRARVEPMFAGIRADLAGVLGDARLAIWALFLIGFPFYVFPSGTPQPADLLILVLAPMMFAGRRVTLAVPIRRTLATLRVFLFYVVVSNLAWSLILGTIAINLKDGFLLSPFFYLYNALLLYTIVLMYRRYGLRLLSISVRVIACSVALQVLISFFLLGSSHRSTGMFNNPNQLGYYALLAACIVLLTQKQLKLSTVFVTVTVTMTAYLAALSASKAAIASIGLLGIAFLFGKVRTMIVAGLALSALIFTSNPFSDAIDRAATRIETDESHAFFEERGYDRILHYPEYWLLGSGEGGYRRFEDTTVIGSHELHSSIGTLFFCYGIAGTLLFGLFMLQVVSGTGVRSWVIVASAFAYGMTHQGLRFAWQWVLLGLVIAIGDLERTARRARAAARATRARPATEGPRASEVDR